MNKQTGQGGGVSTPPPPYPIFVYGSLRPGMANHGLLEGMPTRPAHMPGRLYDIGAGYPMCCIDTPADQRGQVRGDIVDVPAAAWAATIARLDRLESEGSYYFRRIVAARDDLGDSVRCYVYVNTPAQVAAYPVIPGGDWVAYAHARRR